MLNMRGFAAFRKIFNGSVHKKVRLNRVMSTWEKCVEKRQSGQTECGEIKCLMDEICHPEGSWTEGYAKKNIKDTRILVAGVIAFTLTLIKLKFSEVAKGHPDVTFF